MADDIAEDDIKDNAMQGTRIVFGSLENSAVEIVAEGDRIPSVNALETEELSKESKEAKQRRDTLLKQLEVKRRTRTIAVPTTDAEVKTRLRELGLPAILFGEGPYERRERLKQETARLEALNALPPTNIATAKDAVPQEEFGVQKQQFFTPGTQELFLARVAIAKESFTRAKRRLENERESYQKLKQMRRKQRDEQHEAAIKELKTFQCHGSQVGADRPIHCCAISPSGDHVLTGSWDMQIRLFSLPACNKVAQFREHTDRVTDVAWRPASSIGNSACDFASAGADGTVKLWATASSSSFATLSGHQDRVCSVAFHPCGQYLGSTSFDRTWRLWDLATKVCLVEQEGHGAEVYAIDFQCDGALACTTDLSGIGRIWDLRSGRSVLLLEGHVKQVLSCSFSPNGYQLVTGSDDNTCKIWDLRKRDTLYTIAAHSNLISSCKYQPTNGDFIATSSYDQTAKIWDSKTFSLVKTLRGHQSRIMQLDVSSDGEAVVTVCFDRTCKIWRKGDTIAYSKEYVPSEILQSPSASEVSRLPDGAVDEDDSQSDDDEVDEEAAHAAAMGQANGSGGTRSDSSSDSAKEDGGDYDMPWNN